MYRLIIHWWFLERGQIISPGYQVWELKIEALLKVISSSYGEVDQIFTYQFLWCDNRMNVFIFPP